MVSHLLSSVILDLPARHPIDPCSPSPCGPYSICRVLDGHPVCSCQISCSGVPPNCRPECLINAECPRDRTCINQRCIDPCPGTCGMNARCRVVNHNPICSCNAGFIGDPFVQCSPEPSKILPMTTTQATCLALNPVAFRLVQLLLSSLVECDFLIVQHCFPVFFNSNSSPLCLWSIQHNRYWRKSTGIRVNRHRVE